MSNKVSIIIRAKNEEMFIEQTLRAIFEQQVPFEYEVIVLDSGSTDQTIDIVNKYDVRLEEIPPGQFSFGKALNIGVSLANADLIIYLSAHCIPSNAHWMSELLAPLITGNASATFGKQEPIIGLNPFEEQSILEHFASGEVDQTKIVFSNSNSAVKKCVLKEFPFDEKATFAEDFIWAQLLPPEYAIQYVPSSSVYHSHPLAFQYWKKRYYDSGLAGFYVENVCGLPWPWRLPTDTVVNHFLRRYLVVAKLVSITYVKVSMFLFRNKYYGHLFIAPIFVIFRQYYHQKGWRKGKELYS